MSSIDDLLNDPGISAYLATHQGSVSQVRRAAELLAGKPDALIALNRLLAPLRDNAISVFFSYKQKDERAAKAVVEVLRKISAGKLAITYQADFTKKIVGEQWREQIRTAIQNSNWFILLLPDPSDDWDWCLFETGVFEGQRTSADRLICLHHPDAEMPSPIEGYHAVAATIPEVTKFLQMVCLEDDPVQGMKAINPAMESDIPNYAAQIVDAIRPPRKNCVREVFEPWVELRIPNAAELASREDLDAARVVTTNPAALDLFGLILQPLSWGDLRRGLPQRNEDHRWREELFHVVRRIARGRKFYPIQAVFTSESGKVFRPVAYGIDRLGENGPIDTFHVTFTEEVGVVDVSSMPAEVASLVSVLRFVFRFRWEVLEQFTREVMTEDDVERLVNTMSRIEIDAESRGLMGEESVLRCFRPQQVSRITEMFGEWYKAKNAEGTGELDKAIECKDVAAIQKILTGFLAMNQEFLGMAADRFSELVSSGAFQQKVEPISGQLPLPADKGAGAAGPGGRAH